VDRAPASVTLGLRANALRFEVLVVVNALDRAMVVPGTQHLLPIARWRE
jgi:hypothetical protein